MAPVFVIALCTAAFVLFFFLSVCSISPLSLFLFVFEVLPLQVYVLSGPGYRYCTAASAAHKPCRTALTKTLLIERNLVTVMVLRTHYPWLSVGSYYWHSRAAETCFIEAPSFSLLQRS